MNNINIAKEDKNLNNTQKVVANAILSAGVHNDLEGYRIISQNNRHTAPEWSIIFHEKYNILSSGTCTKNHISQKKDEMILTKKDNRGMLKVM